MRQLPASWVAAVLWVLFGAPVWADSPKPPAPAREPCKASPEHRQLDFWIGEWDVSLPKAGKIAESRIESILGGCVILETYHQGDGFSGNSFSLYNAETKSWEQRWVDNQGNLRSLTGHFENGALRFTRESTDPAGKRRRHRMTFSQPASQQVRQLVEHSADDGQSWVVDFDGLYRRREASPAPASPREGKNE